eukprot:MONOS_4758.1-p1 / transcript=MONOS_4758.1 / gene=MONOS_4758 / organism=Monocercomonoides_exilis_PA203 / gene_product=putative beta-N-acetylglucosaminidase / transcript_product=putative beta-N-acetylglucosaminidase / location=Mono_scaffold00131:11888-13375(-) / protein_length=495 / sequence_SO=supercontig / SO=protein_coding / is_pseudo=false
MPIDDLIGQLLMPVHSMLNKPETFQETFRKYRVCGFILDGSVTDKVKNAPEYLRDLTDRMKKVGREVAREAGFDADPLLSVDQEFGVVARVRTGLMGLPSAMALAAVRNYDYVQRGWKYAAEDLAALGFNMDFAPSADVQTNYKNPVIGSRSFGDLPTNVTNNVIASISGMQSMGIAATVKHFPGHGNTSTDSHKSLPLLQQSIEELQKTDLPPFKRGIAEGTWTAMVGHLNVTAIDDSVPSSFSSKIVTDLLKKQLHFNGVVFTDSMAMEPALQWDAGEAAVRALLAGNDVLLMPPDLEKATKGIKEAIESGRLSKNLVTEKASKIISLRLRLSSYKQPDLSKLNTQEKKSFAKWLQKRAVTVLRGRCSGPLVTNPVFVSCSGNSYTTQVQLMKERLSKNGIRVTDNRAEAKSIVRLVGYHQTKEDLDEQASVTVALDTPYILSESNSPTLIAVYNSWDDAVLAVADVLSGKEKAEGVSPVEVEGLPRSACVRY